MRQAIDAAPDCEHVFMALASPVCEVGRDWDVDWTVAEPSSMHSIIQLAGRVQRHRRQPSAQPNLLVFDTNLKALERPREAAFVRSGFEKDQNPRPAQIEERAQSSSGFQARPVGLLGWHATIRSPSRNVRLNRSISNHEVM